MKRYYEFSTTNGDGRKEYFIVDVTQISFMRHNESEGAHGETVISYGLSQYNFNGQNNKAIYNAIRNIMRQLETTE